jgi:hypothetical protein
LHYSEWEKTVKNDSLKLMSGVDQKKKLIDEISAKSNMPKSLLDQQLKILFGYISKVKTGLLDPEGNYIHLKQMFNLQDQH